MRVFDRIDPQDLERREWQLWILVLATLAVFACAIVLLMYPAVFLDPLVVSGSELRKAFFGFCLLSILLLAYLANRQVVLVRTRSSVIKNQEARLQAHKDVAAQFLGSLPDLPLFQARLRAEFKRAVVGEQPFSLVLVSVTAAAHSLAADNEVIAIIVGALKRKLRGDDLIYLLAPRVFCILLPGVKGDDASRLCDRMIKALTEARASSGLSFDTKMLNYPEQTNSLQGFEEGVRIFLGPGAAFPAPRSVASTRREG
jgi:GGDEF domain-containing protein